MNIQTPSYVYRNIEHDAEPPEASSAWKAQAARVTFAVLPFFTLYKPFCYPLSVAMGSLRLITSCQTLWGGDLDSQALQWIQVAASVAGLAGTLFCHPLGMLIATLHDIFLDFGALHKALQTRDYQTAAIELLQMLNSILYAALFLGGNAHLLALSLCLQFAVQIGRSYMFSQQDGKALETVTSLLMGLIRAHQAIRVCQQISIEKDLQKAKDEGKPYLPLANFFQKFFVNIGYRLAGMTRWTLRQCIQLFCYSKDSSTERACTAAKAFFSLPLAVSAFCLSVPFYLAASYVGTGRFEKIEASAPGLEMPHDKVHVVFQNICGQNPWSILSGGVLPPLEEDLDGKMRADAILANILEKKPDFFGGQEFDDLDTSKKMAEVLSQHGYTCVRDLGCHSPILNHSGLFIAVGPEAASSVNFHPFRAEDTTGITSWCDRGLLEVTIPLKNKTSLKIFNLHLNAGGEEHHQTRLLQIQKYLSPLMQEGLALAIGDGNLDTSLLSDAEKKACGLEKFVNALEGKVTCTDEGKHQLYGKPKEGCLDCKEKIDVALFDPEKGSVSDVKIEHGYSDHSLISLLFKPNFLILNK